MTAPDLTRRAVALAAVWSAAMLAGCGSDGDQPESSPAPEASVTSISGTVSDPALQAAASAAAGDFIAAVNAGDIEALYEMQQSAYREACHRDDFARVVASLLEGELSGPAVVQLRGNQAAVTVTRRSPESVDVDLVLTLALDIDRTWRVKAPARGGCVP